MKNKNLILSLFLSAWLPSTHASTLMQYDVGIITSGGSNVDGTLFFISSGTDSTFNSGAFSAGATTIVNPQDSLLFATAISGGIAQGNWTENYVSPVAVGQTITALFVQGLTTSSVNYSTGAFLGGKSIGLSGGTSYTFGTYSNAAAETFGGGDSSAISWALPANGLAAVSLNAYSNTGSYTGGDLTANLATTSSFILIPEPSSASLLALGMAGLVALRARRKS
jgi:PEP-CTERM motif